MDRRAFLGMAGAAALAGCATSARVDIGSSAVSGERLPKLLVSPDRVIRTVVGLRPYRPAGFVVRSEPLTSAKTLIHNYGHGGCGVTLSWGTAALAVQEAMRAAPDATDYAVIGAGVNGLTTGLMLAWMGKDVTIYAEALTPDTTSNIAAAVWGPTTIYDDGVATDAFIEQFVYAARFAQRRFQHYVNDPAYGVRWIDDYTFRDDAGGGLSPMLSRIVDLYPGRGVVPNSGGRFGFSYVERYRAMMIDPDIYLRAIMKDFELAGGRIVQRRFDDVSQLADLPHDAVVNCTGFGARALFGDDGLIPVRGQLTVLTPQPEIDYGYVRPTPQGTLYMFPRQSAIILGGTHDEGEFDTTIDQATVQRMLTGHADTAERLSG